MLESLLVVGFLVALLAGVYFFFEYKKTKKKYESEHAKSARELFELTILSEISDKIGYSLSSKDIAATIASTAEKIFKVSSVSYATIENDHIELTTTTHENVGPHYIQGVRDVVIQGLYTIDEDLKKLPVVEKAGGVHIDPKAELLVDTSIQYDALPKSYFNIPLILNNRFTGIINVTSKIPKAYQEEDMSMLYKIVNRAQLAIGRLETVIENEKEKVDSLVKSLSSGAVFFTLENNSLHLFTINRAAKRFLKLEEENPDLIKVLSSFNLNNNMISEMKNVIVQKKCTFYRNVGIHDLRFNIYLTPVFSMDMEKILGVSLTMQDVTREHEVERIREGFTNMMVHELRAPLTAIKGAAGLLMDEKLDEEDRVKMRMVIKSSSERLLMDINEILDTAKIDSGKLSVEKIESDINTVIGKVSEELSYASASRSILIENLLDKNMPDFAFDPVRIGQVVTNLVSNAIKFSNNKGHIKIYSRLKDNKVEIEVADTGAGIEPDKIKSLFKPFAQANFEKKGEGTGLGLYISKAIVESHGGEIRIESEKGQGTRVFFTLPLSLYDQELKSPQASLAN